MSTCEPFTQEELDSLINYRAKHTLSIMDSSNQEDRLLFAIDLQNRDLMLRATITALQKEVKNLKEDLISSPMATANVDGLARAFDQLKAENERMKEALERLQELSRCGCEKEEHESSCRYTGHEIDGDVHDITTAAL